MSYSLESKCHQCDLEDKCVDRFIVEGAISGIHNVNGYSVKSKQCVARGHLGGGTIKLDCQNFKPQVLA